jgi:sortase A
MVSGDSTKSFSGFGFLLLIGLFLVCVYSAVRAYSVAYSRAALREFSLKLAPTTANGPENPSSRKAGTPDFRLWSEERVEAYQSGLFGNVPPPLGVLKIPSIGLEVPLLEGSDDLTLNRGVGHIEGTAAPSGIGNVGIAGHRDGFFRGLKDLHLGDTMDLFTEKGNSRYVVDEILIVPPENVSVLAPRSKPALTLVTCYPFYFVGSAPLRYIVHASITDSSNLTRSGRPSSWQRREEAETETERSASGKIVSKQSSIISITEDEK